jgi:hypothetical protein
VLLKVYAKCIDGQDQIAKRRIEDAPRETATVRPPTNRPLRTATTTTTTDLGAYWAQQVRGGVEPPTFGFSVFRGPSDRAVTWYNTTRLAGLGAYGGVMNL